jgi:hypothetical protein
MAYSDLMFVYLNCSAVSTVNRLCPAQLKGDLISDKGKRFLIYVMYLNQFWGHLVMLFPGTKWLGCEVLKFRKSGDAPSSTIRVCGMHRNNFSLEHFLLSTE